VPGSRRIESAPREAVVPPPVSGSSQFPLAAGVFILWLLGLVTLAGLTANPVTLNRVQIRMADVVVQAKPVGDDGWDVQRSWPAHAVHGTIRVTGLSQRAVAFATDAAVPVLIPLTQTGPETFTALAVADPATVAAVYPATAAALAQLDELRSAAP
jgi:hypothetical protein